MKKISLFSMAVASILLLLTSCLGDTKNAGDNHGVPGVIRYYSEKGIYVADILAYPYTIYSPDLMLKYDEGDCLYVSYSYDMDSPENANFGGSQPYAHVSLIESQKINKGYVSDYLGDTTKVMNDNEFALKKAVADLAYINQHLILASSYKGKKERKSNWYLYYDLNEEPTKKEGQNVYSVLLRAEIKEEGKEDSDDTGEVNSYDLRSLISTLNSKEKGQGNKAYSLDFKFIKEIKEDGSVDWSSSEKLLTFEVYDEK